MSTTPNWQERYNAKLIITFRVRVPDEHGRLAHLLKALAEAGASLGSIDLVDADSTHKVRDLQLFLTDEDRLDAAVEAVNRLDGYELVRIRDDVLEIHRHGTITTRALAPLETIMDLRMVYTPGVASVCQLIAERPEQAWKYTAKGNKIAIVTNGTAVLGLGDIGPLAGLPVMEGKAAILDRFVGVSAEPVLIDSHDPAEIIEIVAKIASQYGAIQLEDIAAPACFEIEETLDERLDVPVFHDDQHGTATDCRVVIAGAGAAGTAIARFLARMGVDDVIVCDSRGAVHAKREAGMNEWKRRLADETNRDNLDGPLEKVMKGRTVFIGVSRPNTVSREMIASMDEPIVFALANPVSEIPVTDALSAGAVVAVDGRGMNNALAYPGIFRGTLDARARSITYEMKLAAAEALAASAEAGLMPDMFDMAMHRRVADAVKRAAGSS
jgi:malate dehydrogenase (oxaloacetate-decarboxylating)